MRCVFIAFPLGKNAGRECFSADLFVQKYSLSTVKSSKVKELEIAWLQKFSAFLFAKNTVWKNLVLAESVYVVVSVDI